MTIDHFGYAFYPEQNVFIYLGRLAFPIFAFQIVEGYIHTKNLKKYILRLAILAITSQFPFYLVFGGNELYLNTIYTLLLGLIGLILYDKNKIIGIIYVILTTIIFSYIHIDYGRIGIILILFIYIFRNKKYLLVTSYIILFAYLYGTYILNNLDYNNLTGLLKYYLPYYISTLFALPLILTYNHQQGPKLKIFYYIFYPLHLLVIALIKIMI